MCVLSLESHGSAAVSQLYDLEWTTQGHFNSLGATWLNDNPPPPPREPHPAGTCSAGSADAVRVRVYIARHVVVDDVPYVRDVQTAR